MNQEPKPEYPATKYASARDEVLHTLSLEGWANESSGDVASPSGHFSRISNSPNEIHELATNFAEQLASAGLYDANELIGNFLLVENESGDVRTFTYASESNLITDYAGLEAAYARWVEAAEAES